jgi:AraC-like DNA-binding protein
MFYFSNDRALYLGQPDRIYTREYVSPTLVFSMGEELEIQDHAKKTYRSRCLLISSRSKVSIDVNDAPIAFCKLNDLSSDFHSLKRQMKSQIRTADYAEIYTGLKCESELITSLDNIWQSKAPAYDTFAELEDRISFLNCPDTQPDKRVEAVINTIKGNRGENIPVENLARSVNLSITQLSYLFKHVTGTNIRRFRMWHRVLYSAVKVHQGCSLQQTALDTGFSDYAQFSRSFKLFTGATVSNAKKSTDIRILGC